MTERLSAQDWIEFALTTLAREGFQALKADVLARKLGVSRGSFYWHFPELRTFHVRVIAHWRERSTDAIIAGLDQHGDPARRLDALFRNAFGHSALMEVRMRVWADENPDAAKALREIDGKRRAYIERQLEAAGVPPALAATRTQLIYWAYLGAALGRGKLTGAPLERMVAELKRIALGEPSSPPPVVQSPRARRRS
jgi:AcrR family transcriptional regulator